MKRILLVTFLCVASVASFAQGKKAADPKKATSGYVFTDFRGIKWGTHIDSVMVDGVKRAFTRASEVPDKNAYVLTGDEMMIGTVNLEKVYYIFNKQGRFNGVIMIGKRELDTRKQIGEMKYILTYKFGDPELREIPAAIQYYWLVDDVRITLDDQESQGMFTVEFYSDFERSESKKINMNVDDF